jgi:rod shape-determining protein MreC
MKSLLSFLIKYHVLFLFIILEIACITLIVRYNNFHSVNMLNSSNSFTGKVYNSYNSAFQYFSLQSINERLATENARLRGDLLSYLHSDIEKTIERSYNDQLYRSVSARVINNSVNKQYNYLTLNKGRKAGIEPEMGLISNDGIVGVVINVSENYATALSLLNSRWSVNAKLKESNHFGPLKWEGNNPYVAILEEIPYHVIVAEDEEIVTSGYSSIFPEGVKIGRVIRTELQQGAAFQKVWVQLSTDFHRLTYVEVIKREDKEELMELEKSITNE